MSGCSPLMRRYCCIMGVCSESRSFIALPASAAPRPSGNSRIRVLDQGETSMLFFEPDARDRALLPHDPFKGLVIPRPVGWISTMSRAGALNLAPYSYFNGFSSTPRIVGFSSEGDKDSQAFAEES